MKRLTFTFLLVLALLSGAGSGARHAAAALGAQIETSESEQILAAAVVMAELGIRSTEREDGALDVWGESRQAWRAATPTEVTVSSPFGLEIIRRDLPPIGIESAAVAGLTVVGDGVPLDVFPDGPTKVDGDFMFGGADDQFAIPGQVGVFTLIIETGALDSYSVEAAVLLTAPGLDVATPDPNLANDPNAGSNVRIGLSRIDGEFDVTWEEWNNGAWGQFATVADYWFQENDQHSVVTLIVGSRQFGNLESARFNLSTLPVGSTDPASAAIESVDLTLPAVDVSLEAQQMSEVVFEVVEELQAGDPTSRLPADGSVDVEETLGGDVGQDGGEDGDSGQDAEISGGDDANGDVADQTDSGVGETAAPDDGQAPVAESQDDVDASGGAVPGDETADEVQPVEPIDGDVGEVGEVGEVGDVAANADPSPQGDSDVLAAEESSAEPASAAGSPRDDEDTSGGISPILPIGAGILGLVAIGGVVVVRQRTKHSPLPLGDEPIPPSPLADDEVRRLERNDEVMAPMAVSPEEAAAALKRLQMQIRQNLINDSVDQGTVIDDEWVKITQRAFERIEEVHAAPDPRYAEPGGMADGDAGRLLDDYDEVVPPPKASVLWINRDTLSVWSDSCELRGPRTRRPMPGDVESTTPILGGDRGANRPGV